MGSKKRIPGSLLSALWGGFQAVRLEYICDGRATNLVAQVHQPVADGHVALEGILPGHFQDQFSDHLPYARSAWPLSSVCPLPGNQVSMPA